MPLIFAPMAIGAAKHKSLALPVFIGSGCMLGTIVFESIDIIKAGNPFGSEPGRWAMLSFGICVAVFFSFILLIASAFSRRED